jgi:pimeloyl-ACP methyl ester carboxylesterase
VRDFSEDLRALVTSLGLAGRRIHLVGWSLGGAVAMQYTIDHPESVASLVLVAPISPYGFVGTRDRSGTPCWPDHAGGGAGMVSPEFVQRLAAGDRSDESGSSPRNVLNRFYFRPHFRAAREREEVYLTAILSTRTGPDNYPGDFVPSPNWPGVAPGSRGVNNAISSKACKLDGFAAIMPKPAVLWVRGDADAIVADESAFDPGVLGARGRIPGWPGAAHYPSQPMVEQTRAVLNAYREGGGRYREVVIADCGHTPYIERPAVFQRELIGFLDGCGI